MQQPQAGTLTAEVGEKTSLGIQALWIGVFACFTAVGAQIEIPHQPVPYTLQTLFVLLSGAFLGKRNGAVSQLVYLGAGIIGMPVFSGFGFGMVRLLGPSGGYLLAFPLAAFAVGYLIEGKRQFVRTAAAMAAGLFVIFTLGTVQLNLVYEHSWSSAFVHGFLMFSWWDMLKLGGATLIYHQLSRSVTRS